MLKINHQNYNITKEAAFLTALEKPFRAIVI